MAAYPTASEDALKSGANKMRKYLRDASPEKKNGHGGKLKNSWSVSYEWGGGNTVAKIRNKAPHYHLIERGHRIVTPRKKRYVRWKTGTFFTKKTVQANKQDITDVMVKRLYRLVKGGKL